jgi:hypothetical protein
MTKKTFHFVEPVIEKDGLQVVLCLRRPFGRDGPRFGQTEAGFCLRFGLSGNRIFGSETEEEALRRSRAEHRFAASAANFFFRETHHTVVNDT